MNSFLKTALITGATDGIGKATALALAKQKFSIHVLGLNKTNGYKVLTQLNEIYPEGEHQLFICDLSTKKNVNTFLEQYLQKYTKLDVLILNAGIHPKKNILSKDGIDKTFSVGFISRYMLAVKLNSLLNTSILKKVIHICGSTVGSIQYDKLNNPTYSKLKSVWQNSIASALLVYHWQKISHSSVQHIHWNPGIVNTRTVQSQPKYVQFLSKLFGMIEPDEAGKQLASVITSNSSTQFYVKAKPITKIPTKIKNKTNLAKLLQFTEEFTAVKL